MTCFPRYLALFIILHTVFLASSDAQTATVIPANEAAAHVGEYATVEGVLAKVFTSRSGNPFLNIGASYPNPVLSGRITLKVTGNPAVPNPRNFLEICRPPESNRRRLVVGASKLGLEGTASGP